ncbi:hypothetical protein I6N91_07670 [Arthrobacter sp. MSA 4-2]|uniref:hypothetical protein n=1 Tax=Arthrobacter sp. MSA 4-2 TaxID=2794349 RepID=UPI0018E86005|nr:hypothetical protein [Arthrobacter sp. MSA 4-2]MBJ2120856.1 hypothetical protein [Arthrobacter sp. MSA 4-2]
MDGLAVLSGVIDSIRGASLSFGAFSVPHGDHDVTHLSNSAPCRIEGVLGGLVVVEHVDLSRPALKIEVVGAILLGEGSFVSDGGNDGM